MKLIVNGEPHEVASKTLSDLLGELEYEGDWLATALNGELVRASARATFTLNEGDRVEILTPRQGG
ncbi:sulfur carrier protein ThiS [Phyllobacterium myrsinacearum]|jgi:sulfur carrier protein|uniref:Sulfur carrier protein n=1 Tax=Phyllobacterium myrsinacearum TaxID=28101 RepID=A0A839EME8_9HYPH|nr:sulfur carrier protein ThiS [Phyllobacterium myrsinacearum]MBA8878636.1 sulfur carrier protein [Phyllobacterium myrsinacearum]